VRRKRRAVQKFFKTPKGLLTIILAILIALSAPHEGLRLVLPPLVTAAIGAGLVDLFILKRRKKVWEYPSGAVLTALIVTMVLRAQEPWYVTTITAMAAVVSKYVFRSRSANLFNPAALALVASFYVFHTGQNWWGALPEVAPIFQLVLIAAGVFMADRVNKMPLVLSFLGCYYLLFTLTAFFGDPGRVSEVFRTPDAQASIFFAFIILTDPPTSPTKYPDQLWCGLITAAASYAIFRWVGAVYYLLAGVLLANVWEAWRRVSRRTGHTFPRGMGVFLLEMTPWRQTSHGRHSPARPKKAHSATAVS
jgi:Na+-translocating ferredoxin:NAD+ oxidoreductase RnfD subunit